MANNIIHQFSFSVKQWFDNESNVEDNGFYFGDSNDHFSDEVVF